MLKMYLARFTKIIMRVPLLSVRTHMKQAKSHKTFNFNTFEASNLPSPSYAPNTPEREKLENVLHNYEGKIKDVPIVIGDEEIRTKEVKYQSCPFDHHRNVSKFYYATQEIVHHGISNCLAARRDWEQWPLEKRAEVFWKASELMTHKYRYDLLATTILGQGKNIWQAEIDAAAEIIDFLNFNIMFARTITQYQPISPNPEEVNKFIYRGCEGFWAAITPFNFTAIAGHLPAAPALMGNVCLWKPSDTAVLSNFLIYQIFREAGLPPGVINFIPSDGPLFGNTITTHPDLAGINFTGSVGTFRMLWKNVAKNLEMYKSFPRLIGECGGKNMHFVHPSADIDQVIYGAVQSGFEYAGQKCSALSRMYVPKSLWPTIKKRLMEIHKEMIVGTPLYGKTFVTPVIDSKAFNRCKKYIEYARGSPNLTIISGGGCDDSVGYFVEPTIIETTDPNDKIMQEEIFGPIVTVYVYPDMEFREVAKQASNTSPYALTGAIYATNEEALQELSEIFHDCTGNLYINDKSTGAVVAQQPFGGSRLSGTNDKAGGPYYLLKFLSLQSVKRRIVPRKTWHNSSMAETTARQFTTDMDNLPHVVPCT